jgi:glycosidase
MTTARSDPWSELPAAMANRDADWRVGPVIYQVIVDRFAPAPDLDAKRALYASPRTLHDWSELPKKGRKVKSAGLWSHELAFWGGDLRSLQSKLDYIASLQADVLYLNPIHAALSNHKYDATDYAAISPEYGTREDLIALAGDLHARGMKLMLDGVFNHMGHAAAIFQEALRNPHSRYRDWFAIGSQYRAGYRAWNNVENLPELNLENPQVQRWLFLDRTSVLQSYLRDGIDGWRLDTANDLGPELLAAITAAAHKGSPHCAVIGEVWNYPERWAPPLDGVLNMHTRQILLEMADGRLPGPQAGILLSRLIRDMRIEPALRSWLILDNHDTSRLHNRVGDAHIRRILRVLQFALPGCPCIYYGAELEMEGGDDPEQRAPMRWDLATGKNATLAFYRELIRLRRAHRALRIGEFRPIDSQRLLAFVRYTDLVADTVFVIANPSDHAVEETIPTREPRIMSAAMLRDLLEDYETRVYCGMFSVKMPAKSVRLLVPVLPATDVYSPYKRIA